MRQAVIFVLATAIIFGTGMVQGDWVMVWNDEFEGDTLDGSKWTAKNNQSHCCDPFGREELELYLAEYARVEEGHLRLQTMLNPTTGPSRNGGTKVFNYTSGWVDTKGKFELYQGRFSANVSLPPKGATGIWPAFWLLSADYCWPTGGEIDIFEFVGGFEPRGRVYASYHYGKECGKDLAPIPGQGYKPGSSSRDWQEDFHVYTVEWSASDIVFLVDEVEYFRRDSSQVIMPPGPLYIIFDQAVDQTPPLRPNEKSGKYYDNPGVSLLVDWVRVYSWQ